MSVRPFALTFLAILASGPAIALAAQTQTQSPQVAQSAYDPNERICESIPTIGSRIAKKKVCATRAEWEEKRMLDRQAVEQAQRQVGGPCSTVGNKNTGAISC